MEDATGPGDDDEAESDDDATEDIEVEAQVHSEETVNMNHMSNLQ